LRASCPSSTCGSDTSSIVEQRLMAPREEALNLAEIGRRFGISRERARQLEARALRKVKVGLACLSLGDGSTVDRNAA